jgi:hypothetical protein
MPAVAPTRRVEYRLFEALGEPCGIVVSDPSTGDCAFRFRRDWADFAGEEAGVLEAIAADLPGKQREMGTEAFLAWIDKDLSNSFSVRNARESLALDLDRTAQALFRRNVRSTEKQFQTHLPYYASIDLAAGGLGEDRSAGQAEEWIDAEVPGRRRLSEDLFVARIHGRSMEPDIPDGSLCVFRRYYGGSRGNGIYIVQRVTETGDGGECTIKRYHSSKTVAGEAWAHGDIRMQPANPEFQSWDLEESDRWRSVAEFVCVLEDPL